MLISPELRVMTLACRLLCINVSQTLTHILKRGQEGERKGLEKRRVLVALVSMADQKEVDITWAFQVEMLCRIYAT
jgi:hypothetical protein